VLGFLSVGFVATYADAGGFDCAKRGIFQRTGSTTGFAAGDGLGSLSVAIYLIFVQGIAQPAYFKRTSIGWRQRSIPALLDFSNGLPPYLVRVDWANIGTGYGLFSLVCYSLL